MMWPNQILTTEVIGLSCHFKRLIGLLARKGNRQILKSVRPEQEVLWHYEVDNMERKKEGQKEFIKKGKNKNSEERKKKRKKERKNLSKKRKKEKF